VIFRRARDSDLDRLVEIHTSAYPDPRGHDARRRNFLASTWGHLDDLWVAEPADGGGDLAAHAFLFGMSIGFGGVAVRASGVASVGVAPEARGTGVAGALLEHLHGVARERGDAVCVLHAFRQGFYARHGYAPVTPFRRLSFHPRAVPPSWRSAVVRAARGDDLDGIVACYGRALLRGTGMIERERRAWEARAANERRTCLVVPRDGGIAGYVTWSLAQAEAHAETTLHVKDLVADDGETRRALLGAVGAQRDQVAEVTLDVAEGDPIDRALVDMDRGRFGTDEVEHAIGEVVAGPMVRIVDVGVAAAARGYARDGELAFAVGASPPRRLVVRAGRGELAPPGGQDPDVGFRDEAALAAVLYGAMAASAAAALGSATGDEAALARADLLLALAPYFALDAF
jgi:predicted acetyltransferase